MHRKKICILLIMLLVITAFLPAMGVGNTTSTKRINTKFYALDIQINPDELEQSLLLYDTYEVYEGQKLTISLTVFWDPPQPEKPICLWADSTTMPEGATITPPCNCGYGEVTSIFEWTPAVGQAGEYLVKFYAGETCEVPAGYFTITIIVYPAESNPPVVTITSPADGTIVDAPAVVLHGDVTDDLGIVSIGAHHEWTDGETSTSSTIPPTTYFPFEWGFGLYEGWNRITIFADDGGGLHGEDSVNIWYYSTGPEIVFYQLDFSLEDDFFIKDSSWGQAIIEYPESAADIIYINLEVNDAWVVRNLPIMPVSDNIVLDFPLGVEDGVDVTSVDYAYDISLSPVSSYKPVEIQVAPVFDGMVFMRSGEIGQPALYATITTLIGWAPVDYAYHDKKNITNQECGISECVPAAISNSLRFLKKQHKMTDSKMEDVNTSIAKMKTATGWTASGAPVGWWDKKKKYMEDNNYPITTTIYNETVKMDDIIKEIKRGQDIELRVPGHAAMIVGIIKHANGKYTVSVAHDTNQSNPGGNVVQHTTYDPATGTFTGGTWINGRKLSRIIVECPKENKPPNKPALAGPSSGKVNTEYNYNASATDPDGDKIYYWFSWGDGTNSGWLGPYSSGEQVIAKHIWTRKGNFVIRVKAKDVHGAESNWSDPLTVSMPRFRSFLLRWIEKIFSQNPSIYALIERIFKF